jgi:hypothetical protein
VHNRESRPKRNSQAKKLNQQALAQGCIDGGGGGFFPKVERLVGKWIGTQKQSF